MTKYRRWIKKFLNYHNSGTFWVQRWTPDNIAGSIKQKEGLCNSAAQPHRTIFQTSRGKYPYVRTIWFTRQEKLIATFVIEFQFFYDICTQPSGRTHSLRSHSEWSSQYHQECFWHLIAQYFRLLYYVWSFDRLIDAMSSFHQALDFQYFFEVLKRAHHSSGNTGPTSSPLDHSAVSLSKPTDIVHSEGCQLDSCDIVRYTDQCCIGLKGQIESFTIRDLLMLPRAFKNLGFQKLRFTFI